LGPGAAGNCQTQGGTQYQGATKPFFCLHGVPPKEIYNRYPELVVAESAASMTFLPDLFSLHQLGEMGGCFQHPVYFLSSAIMYD
jgi:hypothetical protein